MRKRSEKEEKYLKDHQRMLTNSKNDLMPEIFEKYLTRLKIRCIMYIDDKLEVSHLTTRQKTSLRIWQFGGFVLPLKIYVATCCQTTS